MESYSLFRFLARYIFEPKERFPPRVIAPGRNLYFPPCQKWNKFADCEFAVYLVKIKVYFIEVTWRK